MKNKVNGKGMKNFLEEAGFASREKIVEAEEYANERGMPLEDTVVEMGIADEDELLKAMADRVGMEVIKLTEIKPSPEAMELLDKDHAVKYHVFPVAVEGNKLQIALVDPFDVQTIDDLTLLLSSKGFGVEFLLTKEEEIQTALEKYYTGDEARIEIMLQNFTQSEEFQEFTEQAEDLAKLAMGTDEFDLENDNSPIVRLVNKILEEALRNRASDIHFEPFEKQFRVRFRIDGVCQDFEAPPKRLQSPLLSRLKLLAGMDLAEKRIPQDGRIQMMLDGRPIDFRVSALPGIYGESMVLRILDKGAVMLGLEQVGFDGEQLEIFQHLIRKPNGVILITGPTGSGKTTTLYSALNTINTIDRKIITVENPVEYRIDGINQVHINEEIGLTFALGLRTILRQAPNVILVGEIRDQETAEIAIRAALTGHLVFSTLHTNDAPSAATRLTEMGVRPFLIASAVQAVMAQRLVRKICKECKIKEKPDDMMIFEQFGLDPAKYADAYVYRGRGCENCNYTGYRGRTAIFEIMVSTEELQQMIMDQESSEALREKALEQGMTTLREDGIKKALRGDTTLVEVARITGLDM